MTTHALETEIQTGEAGGKRFVRVAGSISLRTAAQLQAVFLKDVKPGETTVFEAAAVEDADLCGLQLLCSAHRTYIERGARLEIKDMSAALRDAARAAGLEARQSVCPFRRNGECLWNW